MTSPSVRPLIYLLHHRFPDHRAAAIFAAEEVKAYAAYTPVTLVVPERSTTDLDAARVRYNLPDSVTLVSVPVGELDSVPFVRRYAFLVSLLGYTLAVARYLRTHPSSWVVTTDHLPALVAHGCGARVVLEVHDPPRAYNPIWWLVLSRVEKILATNTTKVAELVSRFGVDRSRIIVEPNGVDLDRFHPGDRQKARRELGLPEDEQIVLYIGTLYAWKGVETLLEAAHELPTLRIYCVGGAPSDIARLAPRAPENVRFLPPVPHDQSALWQTAADLFVVPNTATADISVRHTSPMKLFEHMAMERPIVVSNLPSLRDVLPQEAGFYFVPDDAQDLARTIQHVFTHPEEVRDKVRSAREVVAMHAWKKRASRLAHVLELL